LETARQIKPDEVLRARREIQPLFSVPILEGEIADRSIRLFLAIQKEIVKEGWDFYTIQ
jgi:hypothetical protein